jgi:hypothetical protein
MKNPQREHIFQTALCEGAGRGVEILTVEPSTYDIPNTFEYDGFEWNIESWAKPNTPQDPPYGTIKAYRVVGQQEEVHYYEYPRG